VITPFSTINTHSAVFETSLTIEFNKLTEKYRSLKTKTRPNKESAMESKKILVTGASGYIAGHVVLQLLKKGYSVRGTVRSLANTKKYQYIIDLKEQLPQYRDKIELVEANLSDAGCWDQAVAGCDGVMHVASPFVLKSPKDENELIKPAVEGTLNVLQSCTRNGIRKVVVTSSVAAVITGHLEDREYDENDWPNEANKKVNVYMKSKGLAEKAAWDYVNSLPSDKRIELTTILPSGVIGPALTVLDFTSAFGISKIMNGEMPMQPRLKFSFVDVRDVAKAHVLAMESPISGGNRYICAGDEIFFKDMAQYLADEFNQYGYGVKPRNLPDCLVSFFALFDAETKEIKPLIGSDIRVSNKNIRSDLGMTFRKLESSVVEMAYDLIAIGVIKKDKTKGEAHKRHTTIDKMMAQEY